MGSHGCGVAEVSKNAADGLAEAVSHQPLAFRSERDLLAGWADG
jgi:hypothetical protein